jgi:hypothetical protein
MHPPLEKDWENDTGQPCTRGEQRSLDVQVVVIPASRFPMDKSSRGKCLTSEGEQGRSLSLIGHRCEMKRHRWNSSKSIVPFVRNKIEY